VLLIKGNTFILVLYFSIILYIILVKQYKIRFIIFSAVSIILFFLVLWVSSGQKITNIFNYFFSIGEISKGYNSSMGVNISKRTNFIYTYLVLVFSIFSFIILTIYAYINKNKNFIFLLLTNIFIFFVIYKHSYIRHDAGHLFFYYQYISLFNLIVLYLILIKEKFNKMTFAVILYPVFFLIFLFGNANSLKSKYEKNIFTLFYNNQINNVQAIKPFFQKKNETNKIIEIHKEKLQNFYNIDKNFINKIGIETVDVMPVEINLSYAYNLNWTPRPVLQSYSAYSVKLDNRDADFFNRNNSPLYLIYTYEAIDNRYPLFEEPAAMFTILKNYKYEDRSKKFLLLKKRTDKREITEEFIGSINLKSGEFFNIPESDDEIFAAIKIKNSFFENVISIFFKPGITYIEFINSKNETFSYRILPDVLENKVLISEIILNNDDMISLFKGESDNRTYKIRIIKYPVFYPFYKNYPPIIKGLINMEYSVDFYKVK